MKELPFRPPHAALVGILTIPFSATPSQLDWLSPSTGVSSQTSDGNEILHQTEQSAFNPIEVVIDLTPSDKKEGMH